MGLQKSDIKADRPMSAIISLEKAKSMAAMVDDDAYSIYGDRSVARRKLARKYGWAENALRCLRYDRSKSVTIDLWIKLCEAVEDAAERQIRKLEHDISEARAGRKSLSEGVVDEAQNALDQARRLLRGEDH